MRPQRRTGVFLPLRPLEKSRKRRQLQANLRTILSEQAQWQPLNTTSNNKRRQIINNIKNIGKSMERAKGKRNKKKWIFFFSFWFSFFGKIYILWMFIWGVSCMNMWYVMDLFFWGFPPLGNIKYGKFGEPYTYWSLIFFFVLVVGTGNWFSGWCKNWGTGFDLRLVNFLVSGEKQSGFWRSVLLKKLKQLLVAVIKVLEFVSLPNFHIFPTDFQGSVY